MDFAGRFDKYPNDEAASCRKSAPSGTVSPMATVRGTFARGFRAPALIQVSPGGVQSFSTITDSMRCPDGVKALPGADQVDCAKGISSLSGGTPEPQAGKIEELLDRPDPDPDQERRHAGRLLQHPQGRRNCAAERAVRHRPPGQYPGRVIRDNNPALQLVDAAGKTIPNSGPISAVNRAYVNQGSTEMSGLAFEVACRKSLRRNGQADAPS